MANWHLPLQDLLGFMDDDERRRWDSATEEERTQMRDDLAELWWLIPEPTDSELKQKMHYVDTLSYDTGTADKRKELRDFYLRQWKKERKAEAQKVWVRPKPTGGTRVFGSSAHDPRSVSPEAIHKAELLKFMPKPLRAEYDKADPKRKAALWEANERNFEAANKREDERVRRYKEKTEKAMDMLHQLREEPTKSDLLPPDDASMDELHKWYDEMSKPIRTIPFPGSIDAGAVGAPLFSEKQSEPKPVDENMARRDYQAGEGRAQPNASSSWFDAIKRHPIKSALLSVAVFLVWSLPQGIATVWPALVRDKTIPEWIAERRWPGMTPHVYGWLTIAFFLTLVVALLVIAIGTRKKD